MPRRRRSARRLAALSSLYKHLVRHDHAARNPVGEVERPAINRDEGSTLAFSKPQARKILDAPVGDTIAGLRDRAILSVGLQVGLRRAEIAALTVGDLHQNRGYNSLRVMRKGGRRDALAINPQTAARLRAYLEKAGHMADIDGPLFRPLKHNGKRREERRRMDPDAIDRVVRKYAGALGLDRGYSAHSMRATFITTALENGAQLEQLCLVAPPEEFAPLCVAPARSIPGGNRTWPSYAHALNGAPLDSEGRGPDRSRADFVWCMTAITWGFGIDETAERLIAESTKARANGKGYAVLTARNAALAAEHRKRRPGARRGTG